MDQTATLRIILASASPRRLELLRRLGLAPETRASGLDEETREGETPAETVRRLAFEKAKAVVQELKAPGALVLGADTEVVCDGKMLGKPADAAEAGEMLRMLRGRTHEVLTGVCIQGSDGGRIATAVGRTLVRFRRFDDATIDWYVSTGEPLDKAGGYGIQGLGAVLVEAIQGSWTNVVGLPLEILPDLFEELGQNLFDLLDRDDDDD